MTFAALGQPLHPGASGLDSLQDVVLNETWGFCVTQQQIESLGHRDGELYDVCIDSTLEPGHLTLAPCVLPGEVSEEILFSCHTCHPSLCNDNLSGVSIAVTLARLLSMVSRKFTYTLLFDPPTIGAITWLARHEETAGKVERGIVLACAQRPGSLTYKRSRRGVATVDRAVAHVFRRSGSALRMQVQSVRLWRTAILFLRASTFRSVFVAHATRLLPRIPHVGRQSGTGQLQRSLIRW